MRATKDGLFLVLSIQFVTENGLFIPVDDDFEPSG